MKSTPPVFQAFSTSWIVQKCEAGSSARQAACIPERPYAAGPAPLKGRAGLENMQHARRVVCCGWRKHPLLCKKRLLAALPLA